MNITKQDIQELRRRLSRNGCTFGRMCGCYVNSGKQVVLKFVQPFTELEEDEFYKYLEIARKTLSGTPGSNLFELEFDRTEEAHERQAFLLALKQSRLENEDLLDRLYEQIIEQYQNPGNYLILLFSDVYDVPAKTSDQAETGESEEIYEYMMCAICPVELSKPQLGYQEEENRIGACVRDWVVGLPELGFVYPAFSGRSTDVNAALYYVKTGKSSHPELVENVLGCISQRTATEEKNAFRAIVQQAFGSDTQQADAAYVQIQKNLGEIVAEQQEDESLPPVSLTREVAADVMRDVEMPQPVREEIDRAYEQTFGEAPPMANNLVDQKLVEEGARRAHTAALEQKVSALQAELARRPETDADADTPPWADGPEDGIDLRVPEQMEQQIVARVVDGQRCLLVPLADGQAPRINGVSREL